MDRIDETQEAIARIRMAIDKYDKQREEDERSDEDLEEKPRKSDLTSASWRFGAPERTTNSRAFHEDLKLTGHSVMDFDSLLRDFIAEHFPGERVSYEQLIRVRNLEHISCSSELIVFSGATV
jgi:hypothetical protein